MCFLHRRDANQRGNRRFPAMATENSTTVEKFEGTVVLFEDNTIKKFEVDTTTQEFLALTRIALNYQRMKQVLEECLSDERNSLCLETNNRVGDILSEVDLSLL